MKGVWKRFKDGFAPLGSDRNFANLLIFMGAVMCALHLIIVSVVIYFYYNEPELFSHAINHLKREWLVNTSMVVLAGIFIWFGIHIKKGLNNGRN